VATGSDSGVGGRGVAGGAEATMAMARRQWRGRGRGEGDGSGGGGNGKWQCCRWLGQGDGAAVVMATGSGGRVGGGPRGDETSHCGAVRDLCADFHIFLASL